MGTRTSFGRAKRTSGDGRTSDIVSLRAERQRRHERLDAARGLPLAAQVAIVFGAIFVLIVAVGASGAVDQLWAAPASPPSARAVEAKVVDPNLISGPISICSGDDRAKRRLTCIVDGDTGWLNGEKWRLIGRSGGVDAPELSKPECAGEAAKASVARDRLRSLMSGGYSVERDGEDGYGRALVRVTLADGRDAGDALIDAGLAQAWPNSGNVWCGR